MPTIYLKNTTFTKLVDSGHYHDYEEVISRGVDLALALEEAEKEEAEQLPKSMPGPLPEEPDHPGEPSGSTFTETAAVTVTEPRPRVQKRLCARCKPNSKPLKYLPKGACDGCNTFHSYLGLYEVEG